MTLADHNHRPGERPSDQDPGHSRLVESARDGDTSALRELLTRHEGALRAYVRLHSDQALRQKESCSDIVQSVFRECLPEVEKFAFHDEAAFRKWLFQKALSKIVDRRRYWLAAKRDPGNLERVPVETVSSAAASVSGTAIRFEDLAALETCFDQLPEDYRHVITAARLIGQSHAEIAADMGRSVEAVGMLLHRALARLARLMHARYRQLGLIVERGVSVTQATPAACGITTGDTGMANPGSILTVPKRANGIRAVPGDTKGGGGDRQVYLTKTPMRSRVRMAADLLPPGQEAREHQNSRSPLASQGLDPKRACSTDRHQPPGGLALVPGERRHGARTQ